LRSYSLCKTLPDERIGRSFTIVSGLRQRSHSHVRVQRDSWYFTASHSRLPQPVGARSPYLYSPGTGWPDYTPRHWAPFSFPLTTIRAEVEIFDPGSILDVGPQSQKVRITLRLAVYDQSVRLGANTARLLFNWELAGIGLMQHPLWREDGVVSYEYNGGPHSIYSPYIASAWNS
jgi:hypothetical protein